MRYIISGLLITLLSFGLLVNEASAKRFGGGRSFGIQRSHSSLFSSAKNSQTSSFAQKAGRNSRWGGILGGMLVGGLLASLFMGNGLMNGLMTWLMLGAALFFLVQFFKKRMSPGFQSAQTQNFRQESPLNAYNPFNNKSGTPSFSGSSSAPFDSESFLRQAKVSFLRLQTAYDQKDLRDLNTFTVPEVFAEIKMQLDERGDAPNKTEVDGLQAELLDVSKQAYSTVASVRFTGRVIENGVASDLSEIWHFHQFPNSKDWVLGGIQQEVNQPL